jgi:hypothetical protein
MFPDTFMAGAAYPGRWAYMKTLITTILAVATLAAGILYADDGCATEQCSKASKITDLPDDVGMFVSQRDACDHFRGEPWAEGNDPLAEDRRQFLSKNLKEFCTGTDRQLKELRNKYHYNRAVSELLNGYESRIERR